MKKYTYTIIVFISSFLLYSCNEHIDSLQQNDKDLIELSNEEYRSIIFDSPKELSEDDIVKVVQQFNSAINSDQTKSKSLSTASVKIRKKYYFDGEDGKSLKTRDMNKETIPIYEVEIGDSYQLLVSADERHPAVISYTKKATERPYNEKSLGAEVMKGVAQYSAYAKIKAYNKVNDSLRVATINKISGILNINPKDFNFDNIKDKISFNNQVKSASIEPWDMDFYMEFISKQPLVVTSWDQTAPYNKKLKEACTYEKYYEGRYPTGCAIVCVAQVLAHFEPPMLCYGYQINWPSLKQNPNINSSEKTKVNHVGSLMLFIGENSNANTSYNCIKDGGTSMDTGAAIRNFLPKYGIVADTEKPLHYSSIYESFRQNEKNIVVLRGNAPGRGRHAWILDQYLVACPGHEYGYHDVKIHYVRANFGWSGNEDGYFEVDEQGVLDFILGTNGNFTDALTMFTRVRKQ